MRARKWLMPAILWKCRPLKTIAAPRWTMDTALPADQYRCRVAAVEEASTQYGDEMWKLRLEVVEGEHAGRYLFDNIAFSTKGLGRVKLVCSRLGIDVSGELDLTPDMLEGREVLVTAEIEDYEDAAGKTKQRNHVPFSGYERVEGPEESCENESSEHENGEDEEGIPF